MGTSEENHSGNLKAVLSQLQEYGLKLNTKRCEFYKSEVAFFGHLINEKDLRKLPSKVDTISKCSKPEQLLQIGSFLSLVNYYYKFVENLTSLISLLPTSTAMRNTARHGNANGLSRLPLSAIAENDEDYTECFYSEQFQTLSVTEKQISQETHKDKILSCVFDLF